jgi:glycosyltransferase involved in cell wall biosynthesis
MNLYFSVIVPVYNRPGEVKELLESLAKQDDKNFEIIIVEDGSTETCEEVVNEYRNHLDIKYFYKTNEKPAIARNFGMSKASGNYYLFFDSDCILPPRYMSTLKKALDESYADAFGGPDAAHPSFSTMQKATSYAMTSLFTTGGIRGGGEKVDKFYPRSFNMGISDDVTNKIGGFPVTKMHPGEDMVLSIEIIKNNFSTRLVKEAYVYHKRRTTLKQFYTQVYRFAKTRVIMSKIYPETFKIFFVFPTLFLLGTLVLIGLSLFNWIFIAPLFLFIILVFFESLIRNKSISVAGLSVITSFVQLFGYGWGFLKTWIEVHVMKKDEFGVFSKPFYAHH